MSTNGSRPGARTTKETLDPGDLIGGKYRLLRKAGEGAMGSVWVAENVVLESRVAIKLLHPELRSRSLVERFLREARAAAMLNHAGIVRVFDLGATAGGDPYIVMELLSGESLAATLDRAGPFAPEAAAQLLLPVIAAIHSAHEHGLVHRDLKPDNIVLSQVDGGPVQPKVVDFGIAKLKWSERPGAETGGHVLGTPDYMAPEQALGLEVDHRADVWSLCALLHEMIDGRTPFAADEVWETLRAVVEAPAHPLPARPGVDEALRAIVTRGLCKAPEERWPTAKALGEALAAWLWSHGVGEDACGNALRALWLPTSPLAGDAAPVRRTWSPSAPAGETAPGFALPARSVPRMRGPASPRSDSGRRLLATAGLMLIAVAAGGLAVAMMRSPSSLTADLVAASSFGVEAAYVLPPTAPPAHHEIPAQPASQPPPAPTHEQARALAPVHARAANGWRPAPAHGAQAQGWRIVAAPGPAPIAAPVAPAAAAPAEADAGLPDLL